MPPHISSKILLTQSIQKLEPIVGEQEALEISFGAISHFLSLTKPQILAGTEFDPLKLPSFERAFARLLNQEPLQYVIGKTEFYGLEFIVNENVLIPRPETEELVNMIIQENKSIKTLKILDLGTGSGCIPISIKKNIPGADVFAIDISEKSLEVSKQNAIHNSVNINFSLADILDPKTLNSLPEFDIIVSNPPYVLESEKKEMLANVLEYEPHLALFVEENDPLKFYRAALEIAKTKLKPGGKIYFEINQSLGEEMKNLIESYNFKTVEIISDLNNKVRFAKGVF